MSLLHSALIRSFRGASEETLSATIGGEESAPEALEGNAIEDWSRIVSFKADVHKPKNVEELKEMLTSIAKNPGQGIRVLSSLHSCSKIIESEALIDLTDLEPTFTLSANNTVVTVSAHMPLREVLARLSEQKKSLSATGGTDEQTLAGLISTNTAPATPKLGMYDKLQSVKYVTLENGKPVERRVSRDRDKEEFGAVVCSLGALGVLTELEFEVIEEPYYATTQKIVPLEEMLGDLDKTSKKYDFWRIDWLPKVDKGLAWTAEKIPADEGMQSNDYEEDFSLAKTADELRQYPLGPLYNEFFRNIYEGMIKENRVARAKGPLRTMLPVDRHALFRVAMAEWSFEPADWRKVKACCECYFNQKEDYWPNLPIEIELTKTDEYYMSPGNWSKLKRDLPYVIKFNFMYMTDVCRTAAQKEQIVQHLKGLWDSLVKEGIQFKAHWGKINFMDHDFVSKLYQLDQFTPFIKSDAFLNPYLKERLRQR